MVARCLALQSSGEPETLRTIATTFVVRIEEELECWSAGVLVLVLVLEYWSCRRETRDAKRRVWPSRAVVVVFSTMLLPACATNPTRQERRTRDPLRGR